MGYAITVSLLCGEDAVDWRFNLPAAPRIIVFLSTLSRDEIREGAIRQAFSRAGLYPLDTDHRRF
jgi:hypothetical protein